ncbi:hypothetical protein [Burkholderia contaminans]|uniref:hypothetical protein n=1 Tax=Burkholderia contaminans TaxID=488447 RepID=UPI000F5965AC|nr:hypothetical protein [Burkholderia contaminans]MCA8157793.1 hypothetical protein [Burkholderia contaminans]RQT01192.1 hypothetical protein DF035_19370 [Burkholderia contaminans]HEM7880618.1 hypothetical protein [Burkholderia contaminans]
MRGAKSYTRAQWDDFFRTQEALPEKPRNEQRVTVSDAMKEKRVQIPAEDSGFAVRCAWKSLLLFYFPYHKVRNKEVSP